MASDQLLKIGVNFQSLDTIGNEVTVSSKLISKTEEGNVEDLWEASKKKNLQRVSFIFSAYVGIRSTNFCDMFRSFT